MSLLLSKSPEDIQLAFTELKNPEDLANLLEISHDQLVYYLFINKSKYTSFSIPKKSGDLRSIHVPSPGLKIIQQKLNQILKVIYNPRFIVHGFTKERNIVTNASIHVRQKFVLNIDIENFFPSINFGRVRGLFINKPYQVDPSLATIIANICCFNNELPQGAPTSPIISNMICARLDSQLYEIAKKHRCYYSRYADDITFSTSVRAFPSELATIGNDKTDQLKLGDDLTNIFSKNVSL
jgi:RNA-directed DNA polymerase